MSYRPATSQKTQLIIDAVSIAPAASERLPIGEITAIAVRHALSTTAINRFASGHFLDLVIRSTGRPPITTPANAAEDQTIAPITAHPGDSKVSIIGLTRAGEAIAKSTR
jgi:hypothetical protein